MHSPRICVYGFRLSILVAIFSLGCWTTKPCLAQGPFAELDAAGQNVSQASEAIQKLQARDDLELTSVLAGMKDKPLVVKNWYLALAQSLADRDPQQSTKELNQFLPRLSEDPNARYWAFTYLTRSDEALRNQMLESMLADPCLELRYEAVALQLERLAAAEDAKVDAKLSAYRELLAAARLPEQVQSIAGQLKELGQAVNLLEHFGFLSEWKTVGPFDNSGQSAFDVVYPPEQDYLDGKLQIRNLSQTYTGKLGAAGWREVSTSKDDGGIDLSEAYNKEKGAVIYALAEFNSLSQHNCEVRIGSSNAVKVWVNGKLLINREVYHAGSQIDQYTSPVHLESGANSVLVKVCQNEQKEDWAQAFEFQLRFTDPTGFPIPANR